MKQFNNKILLIVLSVLIVLFVATRFFRSPNLERNLDSEAFAIDTATVDEIRLASASENSEELVLKKDKSLWTVSARGKSYRSMEARIETLLGILASLKPERIVSRKQEKWDTYDVSDSSGISVTILSSSKSIASFLVGKEAEGSTYFRKKDNNDVYAVSGYLRSRFIPKLDDFRDNLFLRLNPGDLTSINFSYPADSGFVLQKINNQWQINNQSADSASVQSFFDQNRYITSKSFVYDSPISISPDITIEFTGTGFKNFVKAWKIDQSWKLTSNFQEGSFLMDPAIVEKMFVSRKRFIKN